MGKAILIFIAYCVCVALVAMLGAAGSIGAINQRLEALKSDMRRVKIPKKCVLWVPQFPKIGCLNPQGVYSKTEVYVLTVALTVVEYTYSALSVIAALFVLIFAPSYVAWMFLTIAVDFVFIESIDIFYYFKERRAGIYKVGRLNNGFEISSDGQTAESGQTAEPSEKEV